MRPMVSQRDLCGLTGSIRIPIKMIVSISSIEKNIRNYWSPSAYSSTTLFLLDFKLWPPLVFFSTVYCCLIAKTNVYNFTK